MSVKPIDPTDVDGLLAAFDAAPPARLIWVQHQNGIQAVARAVVPDGYMALSIADIAAIEGALNELLDISAGLYSNVLHYGDTAHREHWLSQYDTKHDGFHALRERLFDLLPATDSLA